MDYCSECKGCGKVIDNEGVKTCPKCNGNGQQ